MGGPALSVLVVTCNRPAQLCKVLQDLAMQTLPTHSFEVIVTDDGSEHPVDSVVQSAKGTLNVQIVRGRRQGPATARNRALPLVQSPLLLFLNDDTLLAPDLLETHLQMQSKLLHRPTALMGTFVFPSHLREDPFHRAIEDAGLIGTARMTAGIPLPPTMFWTGNLSIPTASVRAIGGFDEAFAEPKGDDVDLGFRLAQQGVSLIYTEAAQAWHDHFHTLEAWWERASMIGRALWKLAEKHKAPIFWPGGQENMRDPSRARVAMAKLLAQSAFVEELMLWTERIVNPEMPPQQVWIEALGRSFEIPAQRSQFLEIALHGCTLFLSQKAFWEAARPFLSTLSSA